jgi:hypothetical protein
MDFPSVNTHDTPAGFEEAAWIEEQIERYGPLVGGSALRSLLGFRTTAAFQKARLQGQIGVAVFPLPGRQGVFAVTQEACRWVLAQRQTNSAEASKGVRMPGKGEAT